jgi:hypothetical protein
MSEFQQLREAAAKKRDTAIKAAKLEYSETIQKIAELETILKGERRPRPESRSGIAKLADLIYSVLPDDRTLSGLSDPPIQTGSFPSKRFTRI